MLVVAVSTIYAITPHNSTEVRAGTIGLVCTAAGTVPITTKAGDEITLTMAAGQALETGPLSLVRTGGTGSVGGVVGR